MTLSILKRCKESEVTLLIAKSRRAWGRNNN